MEGFFLVVEGVDGVGKTTLAKRLAQRLRRDGFDVLEVREPGGTPVAEAARSLVLDPSLEACPESELFLILAARADLVSRVIRPALTSGTVVVADRYDMSTRAYQIAGRGLDQEAVETANRLATGGLTPDLTIVLDATQDLVRQRQDTQGKKRDRIERADLAVQQRIARAFDAAAGSGIVHVDATQSADAVADAAWSLLHRALGGTRDAAAGST
jgi:dTMP kinase